ncbi:hypothetical protein [Frankia sp. R82]|uniref:hypothetical protein n=1 Tax=Frankia sp. R82 TaxID=2950553 RepID=UPI002044BD8C|nr:hypothetical protein [Frankia sp. R82]MCM3883249.1 hypothetical protein [Frankia sp. R82]
MPARTPANVVASNPLAGKMKPTLILFGRTPCAAVLQVSATAFGLLPQAAANTRQSSTARNAGSARDLAGNALLGAIRARSTGGRFERVRARSPLGLAGRYGRRNGVVQCHPVRRSHTDALERAGSGDKAMMSDCSCKALKMLAQTRHPGGPFLVDRGGSPRMSASTALLLVVRVPAEQVR